MKNTIMRLSCILITFLLVMTHAALGEMDQGANIFNAGTEDAQDDTWMLSIPAAAFYTEIKRSTYENAFELYTAQINGEADRESRIALNTSEGGSHSIVYINNEAADISAILESIGNGSFNASEIIFGLEGFTGTYSVVSVFALPYSDEAFAICDMADLSDEQSFEAYRDQVYKNAENGCDESLVYGDQLLTIIFWGEDEENEWLAVIAKEVPMMLE